MNEHSRQSLLFSIPGMDCAHEFAVIVRRLERLPHVGDLRPNYLDRTLRVEAADGTLDPRTIVRALEECGFPGRVVGEVEKVASVPAPVWRPTLVMGGFSLAIAALLWSIGAPPRGVAAAAIAAALLCGEAVVRAAWRAAKAGRWDMNVLMSIAAVSALATAPRTGEWLEAPAALFLFGVALWLESFSLARARRAIHQLASLAPAVAHRWRGDNLPLEDVAPDEIELGERIVVKPGERVPVDGVVLLGTSMVNQAAITGESLPCEKQRGDALFAGTLNGDGRLDFTATRLARESTLARIEQLVETAHASRSPTTRFVDRFAHRYTPTVIVLALLVASLPPSLAALGWDAGLLAGHADWLDWFHRGLVLLVIACPCALVISTPLTILCGLHQAARQGVLIKGGEPLESLARTTALAFDKTGTLTEARPRVVRVEARAGLSEERLLSIAAGLEAASEHPLARAVLDAARQHGAVPSSVADFQALRGWGVTGILDGRRHYVASDRFFRETWSVSATDGAADVAGGNARRHVVAQLPPPDGEELALIVATDEQWLGTLWLRDSVRPEALAAVDELRGLGIRPLVMLTGDRLSAARRGGEQLGLDEVCADLLPEAKLAAVNRLALLHADLAMVGDGVNDAPALAAARVGIAFGREASDVALETADVVILSADLRRVPQLIRLARRTRRTLRQNIVAAIGIKALVLGVSLFGMGTLWMAVAADVGASLLVIFNGLRLLGQGSLESSRG